jgi:hypothetical protein
VAFLFPAILQQGAMNVNKEEIIQAMKELAEQLGHPPSLSELRIHKGVHDRQIRKHFLTYKRALDECGMKRDGQGYKLSAEELFRDWVKLMRRLGKVPSILEYDMHSRYSHRPLVSRFGNWRQAQMGMLTVAEENGWEGQWKEEMEMLRTHLAETNAHGRTFTRQSSAQRFGQFNRGILKDRPTYGPPLVRTPLAHGPTNEQGVLFLFGAMAEKLGFQVTRIQIGFPDCEAMRETAPDVWQPVKIELEHASRNFVTHLHDPQGCDLIVCWEHNWPECPLEVIALSDQLAALSGKAQKHSPQVDAKENREVE